MPATELLQIPNLVLVPIVRAVVCENIENDKCKCRCGNANTTGKDLVSECQSLAQLRSARQSRGRKSISKQHTLSVLSAFTLHAFQPRTQSASRNLWFLRTKQPSKRTNKQTNSLLTPFHTALANSKKKLSFFLLYTTCMYGLNFRSSSNSHSDVRFRCMSNSHSHSKDWSARGGVAAGAQQVFAAARALQTALTAASGMDRLAHRLLPARLQKLGRDFGDHTAPAQSSEQGTCHGTPRHLRPNHHQTRARD